MTELKESLMEVEDVADVGAGAGGVGVVEGAGGELEGLRGGMCRRGSMLSRMTYGRPVSGEGARGKEQEGLGVEKGIKL